MKQTPQEKKNIVILGGGFAGVRAALDLNNYLHDDAQFEIILIDHRDYHTYHPGLYEAATTEHGLVEARKVKRTVTIPFADIFSRTKVKMFKAYIDRINLDEGKIVTDSRILPFDYLVIGMGSVADFYGIPNLDKYGFTLKSLEDAVMIRNRVEEIVLKKDSGQFIIGGGGFAGVEFAGELHNLIKHECRDHGKTFENYKIIIVEGGTNYLSGLSEKVAALIGQRLSAMGIETKFSSLITETEKDHVIINMKERLDSDLLIWTGGVRSCKLPFAANIECDKKDRVMVQPSLNLNHHSNVFLAGDVVCFTDPVTKKPVVQTAQEAQRQAAVAAKNIFRLIRGKELHDYQAGPVRFVIPAAGKYAIFYTPNLIISGWFGWVIRRVADLRYFVSILPWFKAFRYWMFENRIFMKND